MVKAGYGNGGLEIAKLLEHHKVDYLGVAFDEGISLKKWRYKIMLNPENTSFCGYYTLQTRTRNILLKRTPCLFENCKTKSTKFSYSYKGRYGHASSGF
jgi:alanine racemase